jgi:hypothetical protein
MNPRSMTPWSALGVVVGLIALALVIWAVVIVVGMVPLPPPFGTLLQIVLALVVLAVVYGWLRGGWRGWPPPA